MGNSLKKEIIRSFAITPSIDVMKEKSLKELLLLSKLQKFIKVFLCLSKKTSLEK